MILQSPLTRYFLAVSSISVRIENLCKWLKAYTNFIPNPYQFHPIFPFQFQKRIFYHIMLQFIYPWFSFDSNSKFHRRCLPDNLKFHPISVPVLILFFPDPTQKWLVSATGNVWSTTVWKSPNDEHFICNKKISPVEAYTQRICDIFFAIPFLVYYIEHYMKIGKI